MYVSMYVCIFPKNSGNAKVVERGGAGGAAPTNSKAG